MAIDYFDEQTLEELINYQEDPCVSIYLPMERRGPHVKGNPVRLENALEDVAASLKVQGWRQTQIDGLLSPAQSLLGDPLYWEQQEEGLALFLAPNFFESFRLPTRFEPLTTVASRFHVKPVLALSNGASQYYVLALSQKDVRLFRGTQYSIEELNAEQIPVSMEEALAFEDPEEQLQHHTTTSGSVGTPEVVHHGHSMDDEERQRLRRFLQKVASGLAEVVKGSKAPVVLAAVDYLHPMFADAFRSENLVEDGIEGNPSKISGQDLRERAWKVVAPIFERAEGEARTRYAELKHSGQATDDLHTVVRAAFQGRVDTLFIARDQQRWGRYDAERNEIELYESSKRNGEDLLDFTAVQTLANGGTVHIVDEADVPGKTAIAAILRF